MAPQERCELCATPVGGEHPHLVEVHERRLLCACQACALLFSEPGPKLRYRRVPDRYLVDPEFELSDAQWDACASRWAWPSSCATPPGKP